MIRDSLLPIGSKLTQSTSPLTGRVASPHAGHLHSAPDDEQLAKSDGPGCGCRQGGTLVIDRTEAAVIDVNTGKCTRAGGLDERSPRTVWKRPRRSCASCLARYRHRGHRLHRHGAGSNRDLVLRRLTEVAWPAIARLEAGDVAGAGAQLAPQAVGNQRTDRPVLHIVSSCGRRILRMTQSIRPAVRLGEI